jgi:uncharacterized protein (DUF3820 family)
MGLSKRTKLNDDDKMPFGKHKGERLGDVPDDYLLWFVRQEWSVSYPDLVEYAQLIEEN